MHPWPALKRENTSPETTRAVAANQPCTRRVSVERVAMSRASAQCHNTPINNKSSSNIPHHRSDSSPLQQNQISHSVSLTHNGLGETSSTCSRRRRNETRRRRSAAQGPASDGRRTRRKQECEERAGRTRWEEGVEPWHVRLY